MMRIAKNSFEREMIDRFNKSNLTIDDLSDKETVNETIKFVRNIFALMDVGLYDIHFEPRVDYKNKVYYQVVVTSTYWT